MAFHSQSETSAAVGDAALFTTIDTLRPHLSMLMGRGCFQALLARALVLASAELPWLTAVRVVADGELEGPATASNTQNAANLSEGEVVLLAYLLSLLVAFIGMALTLRVINQIWPQLSFSDAGLDISESHEDAK
jgi:hypothetical protein